MVSVPNHCATIFLTWTRLYVALNVLPGAALARPPPSPGHRVHARTRPGDGATAAQARAGGGPGAPEGPTAVD